MQPISEFYPLLSQPKRVVVTMHQKPDGDAMGSALGMWHLLRQLGHDAVVISPTNWADFLSWMPGCDKVLDFEKFNQQSQQVLAAAEVLICLDFNVMYRTKNMESVLLGLNCTKVLIDHHEEPATQQFNYGISIPAKSSTCEMVYDFIVDSGNEHLINEDIAACLYTGMMTDTGSFRFPVAGSSVHWAVARLKQTGFSHTLVHQNIYDNFLEGRLRFIGHVLLNRMEVFYEYNTALIAVSKSELEKYDIKTGDTEGLVNYPLSITGIRMAAICIDREEERKWSFRSKGDFDVNEFARKHFEGGGHRNAAGGRSSESLEKTVKQFIAILPTYQSQLSDYATI
jgi:bifunctional oligoribonuclease and PAP phosphatase NrnA